MSWPLNRQIEFSVRRIEDISGFAANGPKPTFRIASSWQAGFPSREQSCGDHPSVWRSRLVAAPCDMRCQSFSTPVRLSQSKDAESLRAPGSRRTSLCDDHAPLENLSGSEADAAKNLVIECSDPPARN
jgi:hypothetical protein